MTDTWRVKRCIIIIIIIIRRSGETMNNTAFDEQSITNIKWSKANLESAEREVFL